MESSALRVGPSADPSSFRGSLHDRVMAAVTRAPLSRSAIARALGHGSVSCALHCALADLLRLGLVERMIPDKFNKPMQRTGLRPAADRRDVRRLSGRRYNQGWRTHAG